MVAAAATGGDALLKTLFRSTLINHAKLQEMEISTDVDDKLGFKPSGGLWILKLSLPRFSHGYAVFGHGPFEPGRGTNCVQRFEGRFRL